MHSIALEKDSVNVSLARIQQFHGYYWMHGTHATESHMTTRLLTATCIALSFAAMHDAAAHHAYAANYDMDNVGTVEGVVEEVVWVNPHVHYYIQVTNEDGITELWDGEASNLSMMATRGWDRNTIRVGDAIRVTGALGRDGIRRIQMREVVRADGSPLVQPPAGE